MVLMSKTPQQGYSHSSTESKTLINLCELILWATVIASCFPYVKFVHATESDLQPLALFLAIIFLIFSWRLLLDRKYSRKFWIALLLVLAPASFALVKLGLDPKFSIRSAAYYISIPVFLICGFESCRSKIWTPWFLLVVTIIWLFVGVCQKYFDHEFGQTLLRTMRTTPNRGVVGLASEPSFYAIQCLMLLQMNWLISEQKSDFTNGPRWVSRVTEIGLLFQIFFLAQSFMGILLLGIFLFFRMLQKFPLSILLLVALALVIYSNFGQEFGEYLVANYSNTRVLWLIGRSLQDISEVLSLDQSAGERLTDIVLSIYSFIINPVLSPGSSSTEWASFARQQLAEFNYLKHSAFGPRIMSGFGTGLFELGALGILIPAAFIVAPSINQRKTLVLGSALLIILIAAVQLALPLVGLILGALIYYGQSGHRSGSSRNDY